MNDQGLPYGIIDPDYARIFTIARLLAWQEGYALAMHGSFTRDLDLIAVPWADKTCEPEHLVQRILGACENLREQHSNPGIKPHGRKVWTLIFAAFGDPRFVDLSVLPTGDDREWLQFLFNSVRLPLGIDPTIGNFDRERIMQALVEAVERLKQNGEQG